MQITISRYRSGQEQEISSLIKKVYDIYVAPDYPDEGNQHFYDWIAPEAIATRQKTQKTILIAQTNTSIVGMIEIRNNDRISLLFVDPDFQNQGIARKLFLEALKNCISQDSGLSKFYVHASPYSIEFYQRLGFKETGTIQETNGIKYLPMEMEILPE